MKSLFKKIAKKIINIVQSPFILPDYLKYYSKDKNHRFKKSIFDFYPQIKDKTVDTGFDRHYVYHTAWAARILAETKPLKHIDISSSLYFGAISSAFVPVEFYDYRPADLKLSNFESKKGDLNHLPFADNYVNSLSCMHTIEHIGLGRYGDTIDPDGDIKAINELKRVLAKDGNLIFVTPVGSPNIEFNAHRIYSYEQIISLFEGLELKEFSLIPEKSENGGLIRNANPDLVKKEKYACGCFLFTKK
ncbi:MAG: DUF268 domain-containing protein [bacterium]|nr:DUF268 domain-containing protein [bacterium]